MTINDAMALLVAELAEGEVPAPLTQQFTLAAVWQDLARLAGEVPPPAALAAVVGDALDAICEPLPPARRAPLEATLADDEGPLADPDRARAYFRGVAAWLPAD